ncbi:MAG: DnaJ domain-containing protein [Desulfohalobiaceae bacterium]|nr:DnaJ domain-containing protein [Desulfohalobiaceae bacterium]
MENRRNYYRILEVQPDAPFEAIKHNYRLLLHKLRMHPDLGGEQRDAALINMAFDTLRHPEKRAAYDRMLLKQYSLVALSQGHLRRGKFFPGQRKVSAAPASGKNQRNYYRLLQVQPDAHPAVIRERYLALLKADEHPGDLLHEAYIILNNARKRMEYDRLLKRYGHSKAVEKMQIRSDPHVFDNPPLTCTLPPADQPYSPLDIKAGEYRSNRAGNQPLITEYCLFCKTPHAASPGMDPGKLCPVCSSPLFSSEDDRINTSIRSLDRIQQNGSIMFYIFWPGRGLLGRLADISPRGLRFRTPFGLDIGQIIKIDAEKFKAVAEVVHSRSLDNQTDNGVRFRTIAFNSVRGNFLRTFA